jgi:APA family basic amino acid/polyamine antiporter
VPILGAATCILMMVGLGAHNWERLLIWMILGMVIYYAYSKKHSVVRRKHREGQA